MGWSYFVPCKSRKAQKTMLAFLEGHYVPHSRIDPTYSKQHWRYKNPQYPSDYVQYDGNASCYIGYDKPTEYEQVILRWVAFRIGKRRKFSKLLNIPDTVPWVNYDAQQCLPLLTQEQWERSGDKKDWNSGWIVDAIGWQRPRRHWEDTIDWPCPRLAEGYADRIAEHDRVDKLFRAEIERLDKLWLENA